MIRNSSNKENENFKDKLEELDFDYQYDDWKIIESSLDKKLRVNRFKKISIAATILVVSTIAIWGIDSNQESVTSDLTVSTKEAEYSKPTVKKDRQSSKKIESSIELNNSNVKKEQENSSIDQNEESPNESKKMVQKSFELSQKENNIARTAESNTDLVISSESLDATNTDILIIDSIQIIGRKCKGEEINLIAHLNNKTNTGNTFNWSINGENYYSTSNKLNFIIESTGAYKIYVSVNSSKKYSSLFFTIDPNESIDFTYDDKDDPYNDLRVDFKSTQDNINHLWNINGEVIEQDGPKLAYVFPKEGLYDVSLKANLNNGCQVEIYKPVSVTIGFDPLAPNVFTPDGDGLNDDFIPIGFLNREDNFIMEIFDMEGQLVYRTVDKSKAWDGSFNNNGSALRNGIYLWKVVISNKENQSKSFSGSVRIRNSNN